MVTKTTLLPGLKFYPKESNELRKQMGLPMSLKSAATLLGISRVDLLEGFIYRYPRHKY